MLQKNELFSLFQFTLLVQALLGGCVLLLWGVVSGRFAFLEAWISAAMVRSIAPVLLGAIITTSVCCTSRYVHTLTTNSSSWGRIHVQGVWLVFCLSTLPIGYNWKTGAWFFENWFWFGAVWIISASCVIVLFFSLRQTPHHNKLLSSIARWLYSDQPQKHDIRFVVFISGASIAVCLGMNHILFEGIPHINDSISQWFQARVFLGGAFFAPTPQHPAFFEQVFQLQTDERWYSIYPPGYSLLLAGWMGIGFPAMCNALLTGACAGLLFFIAKALWGRTVALWAIVLWTCSPFVVFMGSGFMNHTASAFWLLLGIASLLMLPRHSLWAAAVGFALGFGFITRPFSTVCLATTLPLWYRILPRNKNTPLLRVLIPAAIGFAIPVALLLAHNSATTGAPFVTGYHQYFGGSPLGFGERPWGTESLAHGIPNTVTHSPMRGLANTFNNVNQFQYHLFGWPTGSLLFAFAFFLPWFHRTKKEWAVLASALAMPVGYFFYFFQDDCFGPRFFFESAPFWILLTARFLSLLPDIMQNWKATSEEQWQARTLCFVLAMTLISFATVWPERIREYADSYWGTTPALITLMNETIESSESLIFVEDNSDYLTLFTQLDPWLQRGPIIARDRSEENAILMQAFPGWNAYRMTFTETAGLGVNGSILVPLASPEGIPNP